MQTALPCCVEASPAYTPKVRFALRMLLEPLGLGPVWVSREGLGNGGLYYGQAGAQLPAAARLLTAAPDAEDYFSERRPYLASRASWQTWQDLRYPVLFGVNGVPDLIASSFFWLSAWQEHVANQCDEHGRFPHAASLQAQLNTTDLPVVDVYRAQLQELLGEARIPLKVRSWSAKRWAFCPTIDIDYLCKWRKGMIYREVVEYFLLNRRRCGVAARGARLSVFLQQLMRRGDVFQEALSRMSACIRPLGTGTIFLKAAAHGPQDVYYDLHAGFLCRAVSEWRRYGFEIALHPSYHAHSHAAYMRAERAALTSLTDVAPISVRQHFLRWDASQTPYLQAATGFRIDSTLGFAETVGFRHGTSLPFLHFDVDRNETSSLWEMPLVIMDSALFNRQGLSVEAGIEKTIQLLKTCMQFGGAAVLLWHNVLWDEMDYPGWGRHFEETLAWAASHGAYIASLQSALGDWLGYPMQSSAGTHGP